MNFDSFFEKVKNSNAIIEIEQRVSYDANLLSNEALFQLPLISLIVLLFAKDKRKPYISEIGQLVGESIEDSMYGFKGSSQQIGWSANLRVRTVKAISFLEQANLIVIENRKGRVQITELGKKVITHAISKDDNLAWNLTKISRSYRNICISKQLDMELK
ncbi:hypothetical protein GBN32_17335 [Plesiomonas shigelloides]|uniref:hypothetical protein n=1 Tax=Plesiomonas shigelloides TaxID=703 RepID=UPI0012622C66|nr:hypothetical protein [Plesiomonas shigelloides]KAB7704852.1 hypothetical protein GBN32_17335 [Plesiomonas shigelloides]